MRVAHFNTYPHGGAAVAARRFCEQQIREGEDATFYWSETNRPPPVAPLFQKMPIIESPGSPIARMVGRSLDRRRRYAIKQAWDNQVAMRPRGSEVFSLAEQYRPVRLDWKQVRADLVHLHWLAFMIDWPEFFSQIPDSVPLVWTLHDVNPFTGGCHYAGTCERFSVGCGNCPQLPAASPVDVSRRSLMVKQQALRRKQIHVVSPSRWMHELAQQSPVWPSQTTFSVVHYGLPLQTFSPTDRHAAKESLGLDRKSTVIGFGADDIASPRKGFHQLAETLGIIQRTNPGTKLTGILAGGGESSAVESLAGLEKIVRPGFVSDPTELARIFSACDLVVLPSLQDNQPQMGLEAMACGTPVVAFDAGGIGEFVQDGMTGRLVPVGDCQSMASAIVELSENREMRMVLGQRARMMILRDFEIVRQTGKYREIYQHLVSRSARRAA